MPKLLISILCYFAFMATAFAASSVKTADGFAFKAANAAVVESAGTKYLKVDFTFSNETETSKIDFGKGFEFSISDEFSNNYRELPKPDDFKDPVIRTPGGFPGIYPTESYGRTLFFEAPVAKASMLKLKVTALLIGMSGPIDIDFRLPRKASAAALSPELLLEITEPEEGAVIAAGDAFSLKVKVNSPVAPGKIIVIAFDHTFEDASPGLDNVYDIVIPVKQPEGEASISVIGRWPGKIKAETDVSSRDVIIFVKRAAPSVSF